MSRGDHDDADDLPQTGRRRQEEDDYRDGPPRKQSNAVLWIVLAGVAFLFVACAGVGFLFWLGLGAGPPAPPAPVPAKVR
jgi:hypothetical protein